MAPIDDLLIDTLVRLEHASVGEAKAFALVTSDSYTGEVISSTGPFAEPEQALAQAGRDEAAWKRCADDPVEAEALTYTVVPLWEPST